MTRSDLLLVLGQTGGGGSNNPPDTPIEWIALGVMITIVLVVIVVKQTRQRR